MAATAILSPSKSGVPLDVAYAVYGGSEVKLSSLSSTSLDDGSAMSDQAKEKRVAELIRKAQYARRHDANQEAADAVREVLSIDPQNEDARKLFEGLSLEGGKAVDVLKLCREYHEGGLNDGFFRQQLETAAIDVEGTRDTFEFAFEHKSERSDRLIEALLDKPNGKRALIPVLLKEPNRTFKALWDLGERSLKAVVIKLLLQPEVWSKEDDRRKAERDMLLLLLAKLLQAGLENPELAMLAIARLLAVDVTVLQDVVDSDAFAVFFESLDSHNSPALRSQATVSLAKLYEAVPERFEKELVGYTESMVKTQLTDSLVPACCAVSVLFPVAPQVCAKMFLREGFIQQLMYLVNNTKSTHFKEAALELFSSACVDSACRQSIQKHCADWLSQMSIDEDAGGKQSKMAVTAALVNSKIRDDAKKAGGADDKLVLKLKNVVLDKTSTNDAIEKAIEGLQYQSFHAKVKENLVNDTKFLKQLVAFLSRPETVKNGALIYVGLIIFQNLTRYAPVVSPEQQKIAELKAYANRTPLPKTHPLDEEAPVSERCTKVLEVGLAPTLVKAAQKASLALQMVISSVILALSKHPKHRGRMAKDGLFDVSQLQATIDQDGQPATTQVKRQASLSFARIMIPIDPNLLMKGRDIRAAVRILMYVMKVPLSNEDTESDALWWRGFPVVTALQALTNLATYQPSPSNPSQSGDLIVSDCWSLLEDLWTSNAVQIRTAVTECFLNLITASDNAVARFVTDEGRSERRMRILAGYWSEEEGKLAAAAGGAIATLLGVGDDARGLFLKTDSGVQSTAEWLNSGKPDMVHRAIVITSELLDPVASSKGGSELAKRVLADVKRNNFAGALKKLRGSGQLWDEQVQQCINILGLYGPS